VLLAGKCGRNGSDWGGVGEHKSIACEVLSRVNAKVRGGGIAIPLHLTGQESADAVAQAIDQLSRCDVVIDDATASPCGV